MTTSLSGLGTRRKNRRINILPIFSWLFIALAVGLLLLELVRFSQQAERFAADVTVARLPVGGLTSLDAASLLERSYAAPITLWYQDSPIILDPAAIGFRLNREVMLAEARTGGDAQGAFWIRFFNYLTGQQATDTISVPLSADFQQNALRQFVAEIARRYDRPPGAAGYDVATLTFRPGSPGYELNTEEAEAIIESALYNPSQREVTLPVTSTDGSRIGIGTLRDLIIAYLDSEGFVYDGQSTVASVFIMDLETGEEVNINSDVAFSAASTIKTGILIDYFRELLFAPSDDEAFLMAQSLLCSNNSSSNLIMQIIGGDDIFSGIASVTDTLQETGARNSYISAPLYLGGDQVLGSIAAPTTSPNSAFNTGADPFNQTTTEDLGSVFNMIYDCANYGSGLMIAYPDGEFTSQECSQMLELMSANDLERLLQGGIPEDVRISHKNGWLENVHGDAGIVFPPNGNNYIIAVFVWENAEFFSFTRAWPLIEGISRAAWNYFSAETPLIAPRSDLPETAVECSVFAPPYGEVNLNDINAWRSGGS
ncbi:MAG: serine hydrolase [Anaerolineae bacterium]|nr:serine hydrolase [Anaerolineae bacterium]